MESSASWPKSCLERLAEQVAEAILEEKSETLGATCIERITTRFPHVASAPFGERHKDLADWFDRLEPGKKPDAKIIIWPRGGGKSTMVELCAADLGEAKPLRRQFVLYVCGTQEQADEHVASIAALLEECGVERSLNKYGQSRGWRRQQLRTADDFNVAAYGLDTAVRGIKIKHFRPDLIIFDDLDAVGDTPKTTEKKARAVTSSILPTGSPDCAYLFAQNLIHEESIAAQLIDGRAGFLLRREQPSVEPAILNLKVESVDRGDGLKEWRITGGEPTWAGQSIEIAESQINDWGLATFLRESQHEVKGADGFFFDADELFIEDDLPTDRTGWRYALSADFAATQGGGDFTVFGLMAKQPNGVIWVLNVWRGQWSSEKVHAKLVELAHECRRDVGKFTIRIPQDPAQAGKFQAFIFERDLAGFDVHAVVVPKTGKAARAKPWAGCVNAGNARLLRGDWNYWFIQEHRRFREDEEHEFDDQVDMAADGFNELTKGSAKRQAHAIRRH